ncbi:hypothetical protein ADG881_371 [Alcanivorax sp. DG881]|nr:hypothetical protein ADG881_371 [Alcanivorax sp. DG881]
MTFQASEWMLPVSLSRTGTGKKTKDAVEAEITDMVMVMVTAEVGMTVEIMSLISL